MTNGTPSFFNAGNMILLWCFYGVLFAKDENGEMRIDSKWEKEETCMYFVFSLDLFFLHDILVVSWSHSIIQVKSQEYFACKIT